MLIAIDGSDSAINKHYVSPGRTNFSVQNFKNDYRGPGKAFYLNGPNRWGAGVEAIRAEAIKFIQDYLPPGEALNMIGFSRGGLIVVEIAEALNTAQALPPKDGQRRSPVSVNFLGLYDAVNRYAFEWQTILDPKKIPSNVKYVYHAIRDPLSGSRTYFGNTARQCASSDTVYKEKTFLSTHGGLGGAYPTSADDLPWIGAKIAMFQAHHAAKNADLRGPKDPIHRMNLANAKVGSMAADAWMRQNAARHGIALGSAVGG